MRAGARWDGPDGADDAVSHGAVPRRVVLQWAGVLGAGAAVGGGALLWSRRPPTVDTTLHLRSETVAFRTDQVREVVPAGRSHDVLPGTRVLVAAPERDELVAAEAHWLAESAPWVHLEDEWSPMLGAALLDLRSLLVGGASVAAWSPHWRYVWPRDTSHVAVALATAGHRTEAESCLAWIEAAQQPEGWLEARYDLDTHGAPDARPPQLDGCGWTLWALDRVDEANRVTGDSSTIERRAPLLERSLATIEAALHPRIGLPPVSPDYWERKESRLTLGTAAPLLVGLRAAERIGLREARGGVVARNDLAVRAGALADALQDAIVTAFGPHRYQRYAHGGGHCASLAFLLPPYLETGLSGADDSFDEARTAMARPGGGLAPGAGWKRDGTSWTPETAVLAGTALATGRADIGDQYLRWLDRHRTSAGSFPEKVRADGAPASVAPLAWTAAVVAQSIAHLRPRPRSHPAR